MGVMNGELLGNISVWNNSPIKLFSNQKIQLIFKFVLVD